MNKQIEEMARVIYETGEAIEEIDLRYACLHGADSDSETKFMRIARHLYRSGYRKASDVAREIFAEIDKRFEALLKFYPCNGEFEDAKKFVDFHWKHIRHSIMCDYDAELKNKYESEGVE